MEIKSREFGKTKNGDIVTAYDLINDHGACVTVLNYGGILQSIKVQDKEGIFKNVSAGYDDVAGYENNGGYLGAAVGRVAGRISGAKFNIDGTTYEVAKNDGDINNLHGGIDCFSVKIWEVSELVSKDKVSLMLHYLSPDMEEGFPGNLDTTMTYSFDNENTLTIKYTHTTDKKTFVNMTNHWYINLSGDFSKEHYDHILRIDADTYTSVNEETIATGLVNVDDSVFDFRQEKPIGQDINKDVEQLNLAGGYDHAFGLNEGASKPQITAYDPMSGRCLEVSTDAKAVVFYSGNYLTSDMITQGGVPLTKRGAFCLETQYYPDALNAPFVDDFILEPGKTFTTSTSYRFSVK